MLKNLKLWYVDIDCIYKIIQFRILFYPPYYILPTTTLADVAVVQSCFL